VSILTVRRLGRCCRRRLSITRTTILFDIDDESCTSDGGTARTEGALHAGASPAASELISLDHPVLAMLTVCGASVCSWLKADRERYSAYDNVLSSVGPPADMDSTGEHASEVGGGV